MRKSISESKVQRMRNLATGNIHAKSTIRSGYTTKRTIRKEGDVWEERGKTWTIQNGLKQTVNKLDKARKENAVPLCCPNCNKRMRHITDKFAYSHFKFCMDCLAEFETNIKKKGKEHWLEYVKSVKSKNFDSWLKEIKEEYSDFLNQRESKTMISEHGDIEDWGTGQTKEQLQKMFDKEIKKIMELKNEKL